MAQQLIDSQIKTNYSSPQKCPNGCARWKNLAADGNTQNQYQAEAVWLNGYIPDEAGNKCAQPIGFPGEGPWCYCKGTNDSSWGYCEVTQNQQNTSTTTQNQQNQQNTFTTNQNDNDLKASICKSKPNGLNDLYTNIESCRSNLETKNINSFGTTVNKLNSDIQNLSMIVMDSFSLGDSIEGKSGFSAVIDEVKQRNTDLKNKKNKLTSEVEKDDATITRFNRDFSYYKDTQPEKQWPAKINFIEDYTTAILTLSYLFMLIAAIYAYSFVPMFVAKKLIMGTVGGIIMSVFLYIIVYLFA